MDRKFLRPGWIVGHLLVVLAVLVCLRLGRWQWDRMHEGGTIQNFGYAVLWPVFAAAFVYMWFRFLQLEKLKDAEDDAELTALAAGSLPGPLEQQGGTDRVPPVAGHRLDPGFVDGEPAAATAPRPSSAEVQPVQPAPVAQEEPVEPRSADSAGDGQPALPARVSRTPSTGVTLSVATVSDDDDPELAAYNRALAALAEKDHPRAR